MKSKETYDFMMHIDHKQEMDETAALKHISTLVPIPPTPEENQAKRVAIKEESESFLHQVLCTKKWDQTKKIQQISFLKELRQLIPELIDKEDIQFFEGSVARAKEDEDADSDILEVDEPELPTEGDQVKTDDGYGRFKRQSLLISTVPAPIKSPMEEPKTATEKKDKRQSLFLFKNFLVDKARGHLGPGSPMPMTPLSNQSLGNSTPKSGPTSVRNLRQYTQTDVIWVFGSE
jgi:hypothetical protein